MLNTKSVRSFGLISLIASGVALSTPLYTFGQQQQQQQQQQEEQTSERRTTTIDSIDVIRDYRPILADAVKIRRSPDMSNKREYQPKLTYQIIDKKLDITTGTKRLSIQKIPASSLAERNEQYFKVGVGNFSTLIGEVYLANDSYEDTRFGLYGKHLSQRGEVPGQLFSEQELGVYGRQLHEGFTLSGDLGFRRYGTRYYGQVFDDLGVSLNPNPDAKQAYNDVYLDAELLSRTEASDENPFSYSLKTNAYLYNDAHSDKEQSIALGLYLAKQFHQFRIGAQVSGDFTGVKNGSVDAKNNLARVNPYLRFKGDNYDLLIGANLVSEFGDSSRTNIFPNVALEFALAPGWAHLYGGVSGDVHKTSFKALSHENPWMHGNFSVINQVERLAIFGGIKGNAGATLGYQVGVRFRRMENMHFFRNNLTSPYLFDLVYETSDKASTVFGLEGELNFRVSETVTLGGKLNINEYNLKQEEEAWHLPKMRLEANTRINISDRLYVRGELELMGQTYSQALVQGEVLKVTVPAFVDLGAALEFRATKNLGIFARANNLVNGGYERYLYYPRLGMNIIGGINVTF